MAIGSEPAWSLRAYEDALAAGESAEPTLDEIVRCIVRMQDSREREAVSTAERAAVSALDARGVRPRRSRLGRAYVDVHRAAATAHRRAGNTIAAVWCELLAVDSGDPDSRPHDDDLTRASTDVADALFRVRSDFEPAVAPDATVMGRQTPGARVDPATLRALRLAGAHFEALALVDGCTARSEPLDEQTAWEAACARMHLCASTAPLREHLVRWRDAEPETRERALWTALYTYSEPKKFAFDRASELNPSGGDGALARALRRLGASRDADVGTHLRLVDAGHALVDMCSETAPLEIQLAYLSGMARWLVQAKRATFAQLVTTAYRQLSLLSSRGACGDVLGFVADIDTRAWAPSRTTPRVSVATSGSQSARALHTTATLTDLIARLGVSRTRQLFEPADRAKRLRAKERSALTKTAVRQLNALKGPLMKVAQHVSYAGWEVDPATHHELAALLDRSAPVPTKVARDVVRAALGPRGRALAETLSEAPIGVGSIGQVHAARLPDGTEVAVKVRFPGIGNAIRHDLALLGLIVPVATILRPKVDWRGVLAQLRASLVQECDFQREAATQEAFRRHFEGDPLIRVPRVFGDWCGDGVLAMERVHGAPIEAFAENAPYTERREVAEALLRLLFAFVDGEWTFCDPQPGNFMVSDEHVFVVDFGCVGRWTPERRLQWVRLGRAMMNHDEAGLRRGIRELGFPVDPDHFDYDEYVQRFHPSFYTEASDEGGAPLHSAGVVTRQLGDFLSRSSVNYHNIRMPPELVLGLRSYYGTMYVLALLRTGIDSSRESFRAAVEATVAAAENATR